MPLWWPRTHTGSTGSGHDSASEPQGECCWSKSPWRCSCLCWGDAQYDVSDGERRTWTCYPFWQVVSEVIKAHSVFNCTWPWGNQEASSPECEPDHTDSPRTGWLMGYLSRPENSKTAQTSDKIRGKYSLHKKQWKWWCFGQHPGLDWNALITLNSHDIHGTLTLTVSSISRPKVSLISPAVRWKNTRLCPCIHGSLRMSCNHFADPLTFNLLLSSGPLICCWPSAHCLDSIFTLG